MRKQHLLGALAVAVLLLIAFIAQAATTFSWSEPGQGGTLTYTDVGLVDPAISGTATAENLVVNGALTGTGTVAAAQLSGNIATARNTNWLAVGVATLGTGITVNASSLAGDIATARNTNWLAVGVATLGTGVTVNASSLAGDIATARNTNWLAVGVVTLGTGVTVNATSLAGDIDIARTTNAWAVTATRFTNNIVTGFTFDGTNFVAAYHVAVFGTNSLGEYIELSRGATLSATNSL